jgi:hypothetical protein
MRAHPRIGVAGSAGAAAAAVLRLALVCALAGCGGGDSGPTQPPNPPANRAPAVPTVTVYAQLAMIAGEQVALTALSLDPDGDTVTYVWSLTTSTGGTLSTTSGAATTWTAGSGGSGVDVIVVTASDGALSATSNASITIGTAVGGTLAAGGAWSAAHSPYVFTSDVVVPAGQTLTVEPGVVVLLRRYFVGVTLQKVGLRVAGTLVAVGGPLVAQQIVFKGATPPAVGQTLHKGIQFVPGGAGTLAYVRVERGDLGVEHRGNGTLSVYGCRIVQCGTGLQFNDGSSVTVRRALVDQSFGPGVFVGDAQLTLRECTIKRSGASAVSLVPAAATASADIDSCNLDTSGSTSLVLRDAAVATVHHCNLLAAAGQKNVGFLGVPGGAGSLTLDFTACFWGFLLTAAPDDSAAVTQEIRFNSIENPDLRSWRVWPFSASAIVLLGAP